MVLVAAVAVAALVMVAVTVAVVVAVMELVGSGPVCISPHCVAGMWFICAGGSAGSGSDIGSGSAGGGGFRAS